MMTAMRAFLTCPGPLIPVPDSHSISIVHGPTSFAYTDTVLKERRRKRLSQPHQDTPLTRRSIAIFWLRASALVLAVLEIHTTRFYAGWSQVLQRSG